MDETARTPQALALLLRGRRTALRLTQQGAASRVGLLPKTISSLESGPGRSRVESLFKLLSALDLELVLRSKSDGGPAPGEW